MSSLAFPWSALIAMACAGFLTVLTEALPAGLLPQIAAGMDISQAWAGQSITAYALGSLLAAIPVVAATQGWRRRPLLLAAIAGFAAVNLVTALSPVFSLTLAARFLAGVSAGLVWALLAGYAARLVPDAMKGRAIAVAMMGAPLALSLGIPLGTWLGGWLGWRMVFALMSVMALLLVLWLRLALPDAPGQAAGRRWGLAQVLALPGVAAVLMTVLFYVLAHNILYTYIAPLLEWAGLRERTATMLLLFGLSSLLSIGVAAAGVDRRPRLLMALSVGLFLLAALILAAAPGEPAAVLSGILLWGLAFGGAATLLQTALVRAAGEAADVAQSMLVTAWNLAIAGGGLAGAMLLDHGGARILPWGAAVLLMLAGLGLRRRAA